MRKNDILGGNSFRLLAALPADDWGCTGSSISLLFHACQLSQEEVYTVAAQVSWCTSYVLNKPGNGADTNIKSVFKVFHACQHGKGYLTDVGRFQPSIKETLQRFDTVMKRLESTLPVSRVTC